MFFFNIIISKFSYNKLFYKIIFIKIEKKFKINFYYIIFSFNLIINKQIKSDKRFLLNIKK